MIGAVLLEGHVLMMSCISRSTSAISCDCRYDFTEALTTKFPGVYDVKLMVPFVWLMVAGIFAGFKFWDGVGELKLKPGSNGTGIGLSGGL